MWKTWARSSSYAEQVIIDTNRKILDAKRILMCSWQPCFPPILFALLSLAGGWTPHCNRYSLMSLLWLIQISPLRRCWRRTFSLWRKISDQQSVESCWLVFTAQRQSSAQSDQLSFLSFGSPPYCAHKIIVGAYYVSYSQHQKEKVRSVTLWVVFFFLTGVSSVNITL